MNEPLILRRRMRWNRLLPTILRSLQNKLMFWRHKSSLQWDWISLLLLAGVMWTAYLAFTGRTSVFVWFALGLIFHDVHEEALPVFSRVRIRDDKMTLGRVFTQRHSLKEVEYYSASREGQGKHSVQIFLSERYWPNRFSFVVDEEDSARLIEYLRARGIGDATCSVESLSREETETPAQA